MQTIGERIKELRLNQKPRMSQEQFAQKIGATSTAISRYESNLREVPSTIIHSICREYGINREWLISGKGEMIVKTDSQTLDKIARRYSASHTFRAMLDVYAQMDEDGQRAVERYIELLANALATGKDPSAVNYEEVLAQKSDEYETALDGAAGESSGN